ncbi:MAG: PAS domain S-box protein [Anaerolineales bacterium]|nr:PAS domain S-box protein [Anaerolineales bacterium]
MELLQMVRANSTLGRYRGKKSMNGQLLLFLLPYLVSVAITTTIGFYAWRHRTVAGAVPFAMAALAGASATLGYIFELVSPSLETKIFWDNTQWVGVAIWPLAFLVFTLQYAGYRLTGPKRLMSLLGIPVAIFWLFVLTNDFHGLAQANAWLVPGEPFPALMYDFTPLVWVMAFYGYALILLGLFILGARFFRSHPLYRAQVGLVTVGALILLVDMALIMLGVNLTFQRDTTPFALALSYLVMGWGLFRYRMLDIAPVARHALIESMDDSVIVLDIHNRVVDLNPAACKLIGQTASTLIGQPVEQIFANQSDLVSQYQHVNEAHTTLEFGAGEEKRYLDLNISPLRNRQGRFSGRLVVIRNVTARIRLEEELQQHRQHLEELVKQRTAELTEVNEQLKREITERNHAEEMLRASEHRLNQFMEALPLGITVYTPDGKLAFINEQAKRIFNLPASLDPTTVLPWEETRVKFPVYLAGADQLYPPEQYPLVRALQGQTALADDLEYRHADQTTFLEVYACPILNTQGQVAYAISAFQNITTRKQTEVALRQSEALYRAVVEDQTELVNRHLPDGTLTFVNEAYARDYGHTREELLGTNLFEHIPPDEQAELAQYFAGFRPENPVSISEHRTIIYGDQIRWEQWVDRAFFDEAGHVVEFQSVGRDITPRKQLEERLNAIYHLGQELTLLRDENAIVRRVLTVALSSLKGGASGYVVVDKAANELVYSFSLVGNDTGQTQMRLPLAGEQGLAVAVVHSGRFITVADILQEPRYVAGPDQWTGRSAMYAPLKIEGQVGGVLIIEAPDPNHFTRADELLFETLAGQAAVAIENARLFQQVARYSEELEQRVDARTAELAQETANLAALQQVTQEIAASLELEKVYLAAHEAAKRLMPVDAFIIALLDEKQQEVEDAYLFDQGQRWPNERQPLGRGLTSTIIISGQSLRLDDCCDEADNQAMGAELFGSEEDTCSVLATPLRLAGKIMGMISAQAYPPYAYTDNQLRLLETLANQVAISVANARLYQQAQQEIAERQRVEEALRRSETLLRQMGDNLPDGAIYQVIHRPDGFIYFPYMSAGVERIFGITVPEVQASAADFYSLILPEDLPLLRADEAESAQNLTVFDCEFRQYTRQGEIKWIHCRAAPRRLADGSTLWDGVWLDITARKKAEETLRRRNDYLSALHYVAVDLLNRREVAEVLQTIVERAAELLDAPYGEISLIEADELVVRAFTKNQPFLAGDRLRRGEGVLTWQVFDSHQPVILDNYTEWANSRAIYSSLSLQATADFPILAGPKCLGVLALGRDIPDHRFDEEQVQVGMWFAQLAALALDNAQWYAAAQWELVERRRAEAALRASEAQLKKARTQLVDAIESLTEGFALYDAEDRLVLCNSIFQQFYNLSADLLQPGVRFEDHIRHSVYRGQVKIAPGGEEAWIEDRDKTAPAA